jgi:hypothetical protein
MQVTPKKSFTNFPAGVCKIKLFTAVIYRFSLKARVFVPGKPFQPSLMFVGKAKARVTRRLEKKLPN